MFAQTIHDRRGVLCRGVGEKERVWENVDL